MPFSQLPAVKKTALQTNIRSFLFCHSFSNQKSSNLSQGWQKLDHGPGVDLFDCSSRNCYFRAKKPTRTNKKSNSSFPLIFWFWLKTYAHHCTVTTTTTKKSPLRHRQRQSSDRQVPFIIHEPHFTLCLVSPSISSLSLPLSLLALQLFLHSFDEVAYFKSLGTSTTLLPWQRCCITYFVPWTMDMWWELFSKISQIIGWFGQMGRINCGVFQFNFQHIFLCP